MVIHHTSYTRKGWFKVYKKLEHKNKKLSKQVDKLSKENIKLKESIKTMENV